MTENNFSTNLDSQRQRLLARLLTSTIPPLQQARQELVVMHPAARIQEFRAEGRNIVTHRTTDSTGRANHRVVCYVLLAEV